MTKTLFFTMILILFVIGCIGLIAQMINIIFSNKISNYNKERLNYITATCGAIFSYLLFYTMFVMLFV